MSAELSVAALRRYAVSRSLFAARGLEDAIRALGFVQVDPIRSPARAQDLILRHRVNDYRDGDLHRRYAELNLAEDHVHVYGVMPGDVRALLHPRALARRWRVEAEHPQLAAQIVAHVRRHGPTHPRDLQRFLGKISMVNGWGGQSAATTRMLEALHYRGTLRVAHRLQGIRVYDIAPKAPRGPGNAARTDGILTLLLHLYAPLPQSSFRELARMALSETMSDERRVASVDRFSASAAVTRRDVDQLTYLFPSGEESGGEAHATVRMLTPFDPVVWDRRRFEHLWGWPYRFEAYTPPKKRLFGYYAMPLLWRDAVIGWANVAVEGDALDVGLGFVTSPPRTAVFRRELDAELARMAAFLGVSHRPVVSE
jgi:uncharacterized protein YcaQ